MPHEKNLIDRLQTRSSREHAFKDLVLLYQERIYWHVRRFLLDHEDANDVVQNTFIKAYKGLEGFKGDSKLYTWLYRIASNESITYIKKANRSIKGSIEAAERLEADTYFDGDAVELMLQSALAQLPEKQRLVFNMKYYDDMTYKEISNILDTSVGALKASFHHAVKKIEFYLKNVRV